MAYWMFIRPTTPSSMAMRGVLVDGVDVLGRMLIGGMTQAESPEWMPASSMCSITAGTKASVPSADGVGLGLDGVFQELVDQDGPLGGTSTAAAM
jgi:hypothetical protein